MKLYLRLAILVGALLGALTNLSPAQTGSGLTGPLYVGDNAGSAQRVGLFTESIDLIDDFLGDSIDARWTFAEGSDSGTSDGAIVAGSLGGMVRLTSGDVSTGVVATNGAELVYGRNWKAAQGGSLGREWLTFEARVACSSATTNQVIFVGFTDTISLEEPASISGTTFTTTATDVVGFLYDTAATTDDWYMVGVSNDTDAMTSVTGDTGTAPTADTYQMLRLVVSPTGTARFWIDGSLKGTLESAVRASILLTPILYVNNAGTASTSAVADIDGLYAGADRL